MTNDSIPAHLYAHKLNSYLGHIFEDALPAGSPPTRRGCKYIHRQQSISKNGARHKTIGAKSAIARYSPRFPHGPLVDSSVWASVRRDAGRRYDLSHIVVVAVNERLAAQFGCSLAQAERLSLESKRSQKGPGWAHERASRRTNASDFGGEQVGELGPPEAGDHSYFKRAPSDFLTAGAARRRLVGARAAPPQRAIDYLAPGPLGGAGCGARSSSASFGRRSMRSNCSLVEKEREEKMESLVDCDRRPKDRTASVFRAGRRTAPGAK
jgi:hypothetical protein